MNRNHRKQIAIGYILFILLFSLFPFIPSVSALVWNTGVTFNCDNEYYSVTTPLTVDNISVSTHWVSVNGIGFNTTAPHNTYINFSTMKSYPKTSTGYIMNFTEQHATGATQYIINGLKHSYAYTWITNGSDYPQTSSASGTLYLNQTGTSRNHKLYDPGIPSSGIFVSKTGSDSIGDGSIGNPYASLQKALNVSIAGDTIYMRSGDYNNMWEDLSGATCGWWIDVTGTDATTRLTIATYPADLPNKATLNGNGKTFTASYGVLCIGSLTNHPSHITIQSIAIRNSTQVGLAMFTQSLTGGSHDIIIDGCYIENTTYAGFVSTTSNTGWHNDIRISNCTFENLQDPASTGECVTLGGMYNYIFENNTIGNGCTKQLVSAGGYHGTVRYNSFYNQNYYSVKMDPNTNYNLTISDIKIYGNYFAGPGGYAALLLAPEEANNIIQNVDIYNNLFYIQPHVGTYDRGIELWMQADGGQEINDVTIHHNTMISVSGTTGYNIRVIQSTGTFSNIKIANNIFRTNSVIDQVYFTDLTKSQTYVSFLNNCFYYQSGVAHGIHYTDDTSETGTSGIIDDPEFVSYATLDFQINVTSPCKDTGSSTYGVSTDYAGNPRPYDTFYDIGAYEYTDATPATPSFTFTSESPTNNTVGIAFTPTVSIHIHETHGYLFNYTIRENHTVPGVWTLLDSANNQGNGTYTHTYHPATDYTTYYGWQITAVNGTTWHNESYYFTTTSPTIPAFIFSVTSPLNASTGISLTPNLNFMINETHGFKFNYTLKVNTTGAYVTMAGGTNINNISHSYNHISASDYSTKYWWKLIAWNGTIGTTAVYHNATYHFTTMAAPVPSTTITVSSVKANWTTSSSINISWTKGLGCTHSYLYRSTTGYMVGESNIYNAVGTYYNDTLKTPTIRYYYTLKAYNATTSTWGNTINVSLAETTNTSITTSLSALFKGWIGTTRSVRANYHYSSTPDFGTTSINITEMKNSYNGTIPYTYGGVYLPNMIGQTFRTGSVDTYLYNVSFYAYRVGALTFAYAYLYNANTTGIPTGGVLDTGSVDVSVLTEYVSQWVTIEMPSYLLNSNTQYAIMFTVSGGSANLLAYYRDDSAPMYTKGNLTSYVEGIGFTNSSLYDLLFRVNTRRPYTYPAGGAISSNTTVTATQTLFTTQMDLLAGQMYWYYSTANDTGNQNMTKGNTRFTLTNPNVPTFLYLIPNFSNSSVNISWIRGTGGNRTVLVRSLTSYPETAADGTIVYNGTGTWNWNSTSFNTSYYFSLFSFTTWGVLSRWSSAVHIPWGGVTFIVYNESRPWQVINASIIVTDSLGLHPVQFNNIYGYYSFNISQIPYGKNTLFYVSNTSYHSRLYPITIIPNIFYNFSFYLPPLWIPPGPSPPGGNETGPYRIQIINDYQVPVQGALVKIHRYFNTTANYTYIGGFVSDGNGQGSIDLYPFQLYMIKITCDGYIDATEFWTPTVEEQSLAISKTFKIYHSVVPEPGIFDNLIVSIEPERTNFYDSFTAYFNVTSSDAQLEWMTATMSRYNSTTLAWLCLFSQNTTTTTGGSISYAVPNITGVYQWSCSFGKTGFSNYTIVKAYSILPPINISDPLDALIKHVAGRSPIYIPTLSGETVASWSALIASFVAIFVLFGFSPKFSGLAVMSTGAILGVCKSPLGIIPNSVLNWIACGFIIILGILMVMADKKEGGEQ